MKRHSFFVLLTILYLAGASTLSYFIYSNGKEFKSYREAHAKILDAEKRLTNIKEWIGWEDKWGTTLDKGDVAKNNAYYFYEKAVFQGYVLGIISLLYFLISLFAFRSTTVLFKYLCFSLVAAAFIFLFIGITVPMLEIGAFRDLLEFPIKFTIPFLEKEIDLSKQFEGKMYFFYQNKSIVDVVYLLLTHGNILVGTCILLFSIINPFVKLICTTVILFSKHKNNNKAFNFIVQYLGKWSMADVFVVSVFLGYLSFQNMSAGVDMEANTLLGLYFFMAFVVISILSGMFLKMHEKRVKETIIIE